MHTLRHEIPATQYIGVLECGGVVLRFFITKGFGAAECFPMEGGFDDLKRKVSNLVQFVMGCEELPVLPCEEDE